MKGEDRGGEGGREGKGERGRREGRGGERNQGTGKGGDKSPAWSSQNLGSTASHKINMQERTDTYQQHTLHLP